MEKNPALFRLDRLLLERRIRVAAQSLMRTVVGGVGPALPLTWRRRLARVSPRLGYLLLSEGDLVISDYLGSLSVVVNAARAIDRVILTGSYEPDVQRVIAAHVRPGDVCFDVGANAGAIGLALCQRVGVTGSVHCFEPGPRFFERLQENVALNPGFREVAQLHRLGLSDREGELLWAEDSAFEGNAWLLGKEGIAVQVTTIDAFVERHGLSRLDFVKIDVEGMEWEVLEGARRTLARFRPRVVFESSMEFETIRNRPVRKMADALLRELGYEILGVTAHGEWVPAAYPHLQVNSLAIARSS